MATGAERDHDLEADVLRALRPVDDLVVDDTQPSGPKWVKGGVLLVAVVAIGIWGVGRWDGGTDVSAERTTSLHAVTPGDLLVTVTEDGTLESATNIDIRCEIAGGSTILWIVDDGAFVKKGQKLIEMDASAIEDQIAAQKILYEKARELKIQAENDLFVAEKTVEEYQQGTYVKELQDLKAMVVVAKENLRSSQNALQHTQRMFRKGYVSALERDGQEFAVERGKLELSSAETAVKVLTEFTRPKMIQELNSNRDTAEARMLAQTTSFDLEEARLKKLQAQLVKSVIYAPTDGMVVYSNERGRRRRSSQPEVDEGAIVREQQSLVKLPDLSQMQVQVNVHETKVDLLVPGMRARIRIQDQEYQGALSSIANQPEPGSWFSSNVKEYAVTVKIDGAASGLKPGMTAEVELLVEHLKDVLAVPVAAVVEQRGQFVCWVKTDEGVIERRPLVLGSSDDKVVAVQDGVSAGDNVILNPRAILSEAREEQPLVPDTVNVERDFGIAEGTPPTREATATVAERSSPGETGQRVTQKSAGGGAAGE